MTMLHVNAYDTMYDYASLEQLWHNLWLCFTNGYNTIYDNASRERLWHDLCLCFTDGFDIIYDFDTIVDYNIMLFDNFYCLYEDL